MGRAVVLATVFLATIALSAPAFAGSHSWRINEVFSNSDGTIQFVEMRECCGFSGESGLNNKWVRSDTTGNQYDFTQNLSGSTANRHILLATAGFAALPGAPTPDHIIVDNFLDLTADMITYWLYSAATLDFGTGDLPTDGVMSLNANGSTGVNSPTNYAGESGSIDVSLPPVDADFVRGDVDGDGTLNALLDALFVLNFGFVPGSPAPTCLDSADADDDGSTNALLDGLHILNLGFVPGSPAIPLPNDCGSDPTDDSLSCESFPPCP